MVTKIKICGITQFEDAVCALNYGADALGFILYPKSKRFICADEVKKILAKLPPLVVTVGVFVDATAQEIKSVLDEVPFDCLQFHGAETPEFCAQFGRPYIKSIAMRHDVNLHKEAERYQDAAAILLDTPDERQHGGTGKTFPWARIPTGLTKPIILAGGLNDDNVIGAISRTHPYAVDVSSGVEKQPGVKDFDKLRAFIEAVRSISLT